MALTKKQLVDLGFKYHKSRTPDEVDRYVYLLNDEEYLTIDTNKKWLEKRFRDPEDNKVYRMRLFSIGDIGLREFIDQLTEEWAYAQVRERSRKAEEFTRRSGRKSL